MVLSLQNTGVPSARRTPNCERPGASMIAFVACGGTFVKPLYEKTRTRGSARQCLALHISPAMSSEPNHPLDNRLNHGRAGEFSFCEIIDLALPQRRSVPNEPSSLRTSKSSEGDRQALPAPARYPNAFRRETHATLVTPRCLGNETIVLL